MRLVDLGDATIAVHEWGEPELRTVLFWHALGLDASGADDRSRRTANRECGLPRRRARRAGLRRLAAPAVGALPPRGARSAGAPARRDARPGAARLHGPFVGRCRRRPLRGSASVARARGRPARQRAHRLPRPAGRRRGPAAGGVGRRGSRARSPARGGAWEGDARPDRPRQRRVAGARRARDPDAAPARDGRPARRLRTAGTSAASSRRCRRPRCAGSRARATGCSTTWGRRSATRSRPGCTAGPRSSRRVRATASVPGTGAGAVPRA